MCVGIEFSLRL